MFRKTRNLGKRLTLAALALGATGAALANDSSMNPFTGDSYAYFNGGANLGNVTVARAPRKPAGDATAGSSNKQERQVEKRTMFAGIPLTPTSPFNDNHGA